MPRRSWLKTVLLGTVVLVSGMVIGSGLTIIGIRQWAQEMRQRPDMFSNRILARMEQDLKLTKDQKTELGKIFKDTRAELDEMRKQHRVQAQAFFRDFHDQVARVLTPDQQKEWEAWWKKARERAFKDRPGGPPRPGGSDRDKGTREFRPLDELKQVPADREVPRDAPPQGIPERHFAPDPSAPSPENQPEPNRVSPPAQR
jgi:hypothetical protein